MSRFAQGQLKVFNLNGRSDRKNDHELHLVDELYPSISILNKGEVYSVSELKNTTEVIKDHLDSEYESLQKYMKRFSSNSEEISTLADGINRQYQKQR